MQHNNVSLCELSWMLSTHVDFQAGACFCRQQQVTWAAGPWLVRPYKLTVCAWMSSPPCSVSCWDSSWSLFELSLYPWFWWWRGQCLSWSLSSVPWKELWSQWQAGEGNYTYIQHFWASETHLPLFLLQCQILYLPGSCDHCGPHFININ